MPHLALLGDSIFDNGAYVDGGPDVAALLAPRLPAGWTLSMHAVDGAVAADVPAQLAGLPHATSHLVLSVGGNDALLKEFLLYANVASAPEALLPLADAVDAFERSYRSTLARVLQLGKDLTVCTVYNGNFADPVQARCARLAIALFNDVILRAARGHALKTIDLREVCNAAEHYANDIEPSVAGGTRIVHAILQALDLTGR